MEEHLTTNIKHNEIIGKQVEEIIAQRLPGETRRAFENSHGPFDIETENQLIEVKSCRARTKGWIRKGEQYMQTGRFGFWVKSHEELKSEAEKMGKQPKYIFVIYKLEKGEIQVVDEKILSWDEVDEKLKARHTYKRNDGAKLKIIAHTMIFEQSRLKVMK